MRGDGVVEDVDEDWPPKDERGVGDDDSFAFPSGREVPPAESLRRRAKVLLPKFCLEAAALRPESPPLFFLGFLGIYTRRRAPEVGMGEHNPSGRALVGCAHLGGPLR